MKNLREKSLVKKAKQALLEEQERKDREHEEKIATTEFRRHKELAEFSRMKAVSKHQLFFNYVDRERMAEHVAVKDKLLPTGLGDDHIWLNIPHYLQEHTGFLPKGFLRVKSLRGQKEILQPIIIQLISLPKNSYRQKLLE